MRVAAGIEVKCRRCGRLAVIPGDLDGVTEVELALRDGEQR